MDDSAWWSSFYEEATGQSTAQTPEQNKEPIVDESVDKKKKKQPDDDGDGIVAPTVNSDVSEGGKEAKIAAHNANPAKEESSESEDEEEKKKSAVAAAAAAAKQKKKIINFKQNQTTPDDDDGDGRVNPDLSEGEKEKTCKIAAYNENPAQEKSSESEDEYETMKAAAAAAAAKQKKTVKQSRYKSSKPLIPPPGIILRIKSEVVKPPQTFKLSDCKFTCHTHTRRKTLFLFSFFSANRRGI
jgi:hypothetical protein